MRARPTSRRLPGAEMARSYRLDQAPMNALRRPELACDDAWVAAFLERAEVGQVATRWDEQPFITATTFWHDPQRQEIYFHSNITGRLRANIDRHPQVCFSAFQAGRLLPSNVALEFSIQYESVVVFGRARRLKDPEDCRRALNGLLSKYFPQMQPGQDYRPVTAEELKRTAVYALAIDSWSGKRNWPEAADQSEDWPKLEGAPGG
jgi:uncharacterized protein